MAFFENDDLIDCMRHEFSCEDRTRLSERFFKQRKSAVPGGLALNFRRDVQSDSDEYECIHHDNFEENVSEPRTSEVIKEHLQSLLEQIDFPLVCYSEKDSDEVKENYRSVLPRKQNSTEWGCPLREEAVSHEGCSSHFDPKLAMYAPFESFDFTTAKTFKVLYPFADRSETENFGCWLSINVIPSAHVSDLIGLCCYKYMWNKRAPKLSDPKTFEFRMADRNGEYDQDLPPLEDYHIVENIGSCWSTVALVPRTNFDPFNIIVHIPSGKAYRFSVETLDTTLEWLFNKVLENRIRDGEFSQDVHLIGMVHDLETLTKPDSPLVLKNTIGSAESREFMMTKKNCGKGSYLESLIASRSPSSHLASEEMILNQCSPSKTCLEVMDESVYFVRKLHKYKSNWKSYLYLRENSVEIVPIISTSKFGKVLLSKKQKCVKFSWNHVAKFTAASGSRGKRVIQMVRLSHRDFNVGEMTQDCEMKFRPCIPLCEWEKLRKLLEDARWKVINLEVDINSAWDVCTKVNQKLKSRPSLVSFIYESSEGGAKTPVQAVDALSHVTDRSSSSLSKGALILSKYDCIDVPRG